MADTQHRRVASGGFWNSKQPLFSRETQELLKEMMRESKLTNFQQRQLDKSVKNGTSLPLKCPPTCSEQEDVVGEAPSLTKAISMKNYVGGKRKKETMEALGAFEKPLYSPSPVRGRSPKEKEKLANIMAFGRENPPPKIKNIPQKPKSPEPEVDRFKELQMEVAERKKFLMEMESLGQGSQYNTIINTEISKILREMELIDKKRTKELEKLKDERDQSKIMAETSDSDALLPTPK